MSIELLRWHGLGVDVDFLQGESMIERRSSASDDTWKKLDYGDTTV